MLALPKNIEGQYEILAKLEEGGMGAVYKARHRLLDQIRVIKVVRPELAGKPGLRKRFLREARAASRLVHPNIAQLHDFSVDDEGRAYIVIEFIDGVTLQEVLEKSGPPSVGFALEIARQCLAALGCVHSKDFVHRDVSPDNFMLTTDYERRPLVKLIDLGLVKTLRTQAALTESGVFVGKARYASPEQFEGSEAKVDRRSDFYSFGIMLYQLLTGRLPIEGETLSALAAGHTWRPPLAFEVSDPDGSIPPGLREIVLRALEKSPDRRMDSAGEFLGLLAELPEQPGWRPEDVTLAMDTTLAIGPDLQPSYEPGSSQDRLDEQFDLDGKRRGVERDDPSRRVLRAVPVQPERTGDTAATLAAGESPRTRRAPEEDRSTRGMTAGWKPWPLAAAVLLLAGAGTWWALQRDRTLPEPDSAPRAASTTGTDSDVGFDSNGSGDAAPQGRDSGPGAPTASVVADTVGPDTEADVASVTSPVPSDDPTASGPRAMQWPAPSVWDNAVCVEMVGGAVSGGEPRAALIRQLQRAGVAILVDPSRCRWRLDVSVDSGFQEDLVLDSIVLRTHAQVTVSAIDQQTGLLLFHQLSPRRANTIQDRAIARSAAVTEATESLLAEHPEMLSTLIAKTRENV